MEDADDDDVPPHNHNNTKDDPHPAWKAIVHILLTGVVYTVLLIWISFGPDECPKK